MTLWLLTSLALAQGPHHEAVPHFLPVEVDEAWHFVNPEDPAAPVGDPWIYVPPVLDEPVDAPQADAEAQPQTSTALAEADAPPEGNEPSPGLAPAWLPPGPQGGVWRALLYALLGFMALALSLIAGRAARRLPQAGLLPGLLGALNAAGRAAAVPLGALVLYALAPVTWRWAGPIAFATVAVAMGWVTRDLLADLFAGAVLQLERRIRPGARLVLQDVEGVVISVGWRVTGLALDNGRQVFLPNARVARIRIELDPDRYSPVSVPVHVGRVAALRGDDHMHTTWVRQTLEELALLSPYLAPSRPPHVWRDPDRADVWVVQARVVSPDHVEDFRGALVEQASEVFSAYEGEG